MIILINDSGEPSRERVNKLHFPVFLVVLNSQRENRPKKRNKSRTRTQSDDEVPLREYIYNFNGIYTCVSIIINVCCLCLC